MVWVVEVDEGGAVMVVAVAAGGDDDDDDAGLWRGSMPGYICGLGSLF